MKTNNFFSFLLLPIFLFGIVLNVILLHKHFLCKEYILMFKDILFAFIEIAVFLQISYDLKFPNKLKNIEKKDISATIIVSICFILFTIIVYFFNDILTPSICK